MKDTTKMTQLERNVFGDNLIKELAKETIKELLPQIAKFVGQKILLSDGVTTSKKFKDGVNVTYNKTVGDGQNLRTRIEVGRYNISIVQDVTVKDQNYPDGGYGVTYYKQHTYIGTMKDNVLTNTMTFEEVVNAAQLDERNDPEEVAENLKKIRDLESELRNLKFKYEKFGKYY